MANIVENVLRFKSSNKEQIKEMLELVKGYETPFSFNNIIPMPPELTITSCGYGSMGMSIIDKTASEGTINEFKSFDKEQQEQIMELGQQYLNNRLKFSFTDWYDWCIENWGTKWYAMNVEVWEDDEITFDTVWNTPEPIIKTLSKMFPDIEFRVLFADEDTGYNCGEYAYCNGELIYCYLPGGGSSDALKFLIDNGFRNSEDYELVDNEYKYIEE